MDEAETAVPTANDRAWAFIEWLAADADCDCECWGHEEGEPCTSECNQCMWCQASDLLVRRNQETGAAMSTSEESRSGSREGRANG